MSLESLFSRNRLTFSTIRSVIARLVQVNSKPEERSSVGGMDPPAEHGLCQMFSGKNSQKRLPRPSTRD
jgi:hypothetical protein